MRAHRRPRDTALGAAGRAAAWAAAAGVAAATLVLAGCQGSEPDRTVTTPATPDAGTYDEEELGVYREAVRRVEEFEAVNQTFLAAGEATDEAKRFYQRRLREWEPTWEQLQQYEREDIEVARAPVVLGTGAASIKSFQDDAAEVVLVRCVDLSDVGMTRDGAPVPAVEEEPVIQEVVVIRYENRTWRIASFTTTDEPCTG